MPSGSLQDASHFAIGLTRPRDAEKGSRTTAA